MHKKLNLHNFKYSSYNKYIDILNRSNPYFIVTFLFFILLLALNSCNKEETDENNPQKPIQTERERILTEYISNYVGSNVINCGWTGNSTTCNPGTISEDAMKKTLQRINYFRKMAGLNYDIVFDSVKNIKCQNAALMMYANNALNHYPPATWNCYSTDGKTAAGNSNIAIGSHSSNAITLYINDPGTNNYAVGHRRWILYSKAKVFGPVQLIILMPYGCSEITEIPHRQIFPNSFHGLRKATSLLLWYFTDGHLASLMLIFQMLW